MSTWVLLRGLTRDSRHWHDFPARLRAVFPGDTVLPIDLPGNGELNAMHSPADVAGMTAHCRAHLQQRGLATPVRLLAMSLGAMVAIDWAARYPQEIERAALINTSARDFSPFYRRLRPRNYPALLACLLIPTARRWETSILAMTSHHPPDVPTLLRDWIAWRHARPVSLPNALRQLLAAARFRLPPLKPQCPLLLLASRQDGLVDARSSMALAEHYGAEIAWHDSAGHDLPLDDPIWVAEKLQKWSSP